jgi:5-deoxy-5-amino-3-dehydroquinate synthase
MIVAVKLDSRSYDVVLATGARHQLGALVRERAPRAQCAVVVTSPSLRREPWFDFATGLNQHVVEVPDGEAAKSWEVVGALCERFADHQLSRDDVVVGVGGGAITDVAGFAAAVYLRGISLIQIPTSLVGQVDAAIGGKTGVNLRAGKNLAGSFHQPLGVLCDFETLSTLPERERLSGMGEIAKSWLLEERLAQDLGERTIDELVTMAVRLKAELVSTDEREGARRALLNYGHTLGHALEIVALERGRDELRHGEAVAIGLAFAVRLAHALGRVDAVEIANHDEVLRALGLSVNVPRFVTNDALVAAMRHDKKAHHDLTFVLAGPDGFEVVAGVEAHVVIDVLDSFRGGT